MNSILGFFRDVKYYLTTKLAKDIYNGIAGFYIILFIISTFLIVVVDENTERFYCQWQPERGITKIYWVAEYFPRKTSCWLWMSEEELGHVGQN